MKKARTGLVIATSLVLIGCIVFAGVMEKLKWDFTKLSTVKFVTNTYEISEEFSRISIETNTADIVFALSDDEKCKVVCYEEENATHSIAVINSILTIELNDKRTLYNRIGINLESSKITVYLPKTDYTSLLINESTGDIVIPNDFNFEGVDISLSTGDVDFCASASGCIKIKTNTGNIRIENISATALDLSVSTGKVYLTDVACENLTASGNTGDISLKNVIAAEKFVIERSTGDVRFDCSDAADIFVQTDTGDVTGTLLSGKVFFVETDTGKIDVPKNTSGGVCEVKTDTGNIHLDIQ